MTADENTRLLLLDFHGRPSPLSDPEVTAWYQRLGQTEGHLVPGLGTLVARMRGAQSGTLPLPEAEATRLGMGAADVVATLMPIRMMTWPDASSPRQTRLPKARVHVCNCPFWHPALVSGPLGALAAR